LEANQVRLEGEQTKNAEPRILPLNGMSDACPKSLTAGDAEADFNASSIKVLPETTEEKK
jgi:hypothetical protein